MKPILKLYRGYANEQELIVMGHVFKPTSIKDYDFQKKNLKNATSIINMFRIKTQSNADVYLEHNNTKIHTKTLKDGYFKFCVPLDKIDNYGWIEYKVSIVYNHKTITTKESYIHPHKGNLGIISDIDDTFLVSHSLNPIKKLYILLFKNINNRKIFKDVVSHYQALSSSGRSNNEEKNAFFYVSSSEWNLYRFITKFTEIHQLPKAVLLLKDIKTSLTDFFFTSSNHNHKFEKIKHILEFYPNLEYVLLGDDSQDDPLLYEAICKIFPVSVKAVYIRQTGNHKKKAAIDVLNTLESLKVAVCYFKNSSEAITHSKAIGII
ncbi:App1 family protein [Flavobacterium myungsuense]|uniref:App1 family protein n=1 Tax=Flavobacterium myungsuense TaxID=651823 RepID=A0ABW3J0N3_9FLAO